MGAKYKIPFTVTTTLAVDLLRISAPATKALIVHEFILDNANNTDSEQVEVLVHINGTTDGSGGTALTPHPLSGSYIAAATVGLAAVSGNTTPTTAGTTLDSRGFNVLTGLPAVDLPVGVCELSPSARWVARLVTVPNSSITFKGHATVEVIG